MTYMPIYEIKITLQGIQPPVWRRIHAPGNISLYKLHRIFQVAMGWTNSHLYEFQIEKVRLGDPDPEEPDGTLNARKFKLSKLAADGINRFIYLYDFGDNWKHEVVIEKQLPTQESANFPICVAGRRACPPEDCGGVHGYESLMEIMANPDHKEYRDMISWLGGRFDPELFDLAKVNYGLKSLR